MPENTFESVRVTDMTKSQHKVLEKHYHHDAIKEERESEDGSFARKSNDYFDEGTF